MMLGPPIGGRSASDILGVAKRESQLDTTFRFCSQPRPGSRPARTDQAVNIDRYPFC